MKNFKFLIYFLFAFLFYSKLGNAVFVSSERDVVGREQVIGDGLGNADEEEDESNKTPVKTPKNSLKNTTDDRLESIVKAVSDEENMKTEFALKEDYETNEKSLNFNQETDDEPEEENNKESLRQHNRRHKKRHRNLKNHLKKQNTTETPMATGDAELYDQKLNVISQSGGSGDERDMEASLKAVYYSKSSDSPIDDENLDDYWNNFYMPNPITIFFVFLVIGLLIAAMKYKSYHSGVGATVIAVRLEESLNGQQNGEKVESNPAKAVLY